MSVLIIGGGIGGLSTALALVRQGIDVRVFEAAPELQAVGKGIWVPTNAMQVLDQLGVGRRVARQGVPLERLELADAKDGLLAAIDLEDVKQRFGWSTISIHRATLQRTLVDALPPGALALDMRCLGVRQEDGRVVATFTDGSTVEGKALVGADGIHSIVREACVPGASLRYSRQTCYRGIAYVRLSEVWQRTAREVWGGAVRFGFSAIAPEQIYWFAPVTAPAHTSGVSDGVKNRLEEHYRAFPEPIPTILRHTPEVEIIQTDLYDIPPIDRWVSGCIALVGDAAHAMTPNLGQGGAQAIEDAHMLARVYARDGGFEAYPRRRMHKAHRLTRLSWWFGQMAHLEHPAARWLRNWTLRLTPEWMSRRQMDRIYSLQD